MSAPKTKVVKCKSAISVLTAQRGDWTLSVSTLMSANPESGVSLKRTVQWKHVTLLERQPSSEPCSSPVLLGTTGAVRFTCWAYLNLKGI